jgi:hypothetical protein
MLENTIVEVSPQLYKNVCTFTSEPIKGTKAQKTETIYNATVTYNDDVFDADEDSMNRMSRHIQLANYKFNKLSSEGESNAYQQAYIDTTVDWKLADNSIQTVTIETLCKVQELAVENMTNRWL